MPRQRTFSFRPIFSLYVVLTVAPDRAADLHISEVQMGKKHQEDSATQPEHTSPSETKPSLRLGKDCKYAKELRRLEIELVKLHEWVRHKGLRVVALFEGRDAAGKGGTCFETKIAVRGR